MHGRRGESQSIKNAANFGGGVSKQSREFHLFVADGGHFLQRAREVALHGLRTL